jgi:two-component system, chemotaxis family, sensor kinase CheA
VRDLGGELNKKIALEIHGQETELDKSLLEAIKDPLTHIVRNSCDHGIESPEFRKEQGKLETGKIEIRSFHEGGQVVIVVRDDGKGLSREHLIQKALEKGLISSAQVSGLSDKEAFELIFAPGFSTASNVTNVSGRGVGMDVVRTNIEKIGGSVELEGKAGEGTTIKIKIPLTLAIVPALIVKCLGGTFAIPQVKIDELVRVDMSSSQKIEILHGSPVFRLRGKILPLIDLNRILQGDKNDQVRRDVEAINIVVVNADNITFGLIVDEIQDTYDIVVKPLNRLFKALQIYSGATILGDGSISLIFDIIGISKLAQLNLERDKVKIATDEYIISEVSELLIVKLRAKSKHALALNYVQRLEEFKVSDVELSGHYPILRYRGELLTLIDSNFLLDYSTEPFSNQGDGTLSVVVIERGGRLYGLIVDEVLDTLSTTDSICAPVVKECGIFGNLNTKEELIVIVDPYELIDKAFGVEDRSPDVKDVNIESSGENILLVEDTVYFRKIMQTLLEDKGYRVYVAQNGLEALTLLDQLDGQIDLVVSDIEMPKMNGFEMARKIRATPKYRHIPLLAVSSRSDKSYRQNGTEAGFDIYLEKLKPHVLLAAISELNHKRKGVA